MIVSAAIVLGAIVGLVASCIRYREWRDIEVGGEDHPGEVAIDRHGEGWSATIADGPFKFTAAASTPEDAACEAIALWREHAEQETPCTRN